MSGFHGQLDAGNNNALYRNVQAHDRGMEIGG
jgi:hypothetical protein